MQLNIWNLKKIFKKKKNLSWKIIWVEIMWVKKLYESKLYEPILYVMELYESKLYEMLLSHMSAPKYEIIMCYNKLTILSMLYV